MSNKFCILGYPILVENQKYFTNTDGGDSANRVFLFKLNNMEEIKLPIIAYKGNDIGYIIDFDSDSDGNIYLIGFIMNSLISINEDNVWYLKDTMITNIFNERLN